MIQSEKKEKPKSALAKKFDNFAINFLTPISIKEMLLFVNNLRTMVKAGLSLVEALRILSMEIENKKLKKIIFEVKQEVEKGKTLSESLALNPKIFPPVYTSMIAAGENAGKTEEALEQVRNQMKRAYELNSSIRGALIYPAVILTAIIGIGIEMVVFVLPKIMIMFKEFNAELPLPTKILMWIMNFLTNYGLYALAFLIILYFLLSRLYKKPAVKKFSHNFFLKLPIFGNVIKKINIARFSLTLSSLLQSTIPIIDATRITADVMGNLTYKNNLIATAESLKKGETLSEILARYPITFPPMVTEMIMVGEQSGKTEDMLNELSEFYGKEVDGIMKNFSTIIEPVIILILGLAVAGIAVSVIMPMYSLAESF